MGKYEFSLKGPKAVDKFAINRKRLNSPSNFAKYAGNSAEDIRRGNELRGQYRIQIHDEISNPSKATPVAGCLDL